MGLTPPSRPAHWWLLAVAQLVLAHLALTGCPSDPPPPDAGIVDGGGFPVPDGGMPPDTTVTIADLYGRLIDPVGLTSLPSPFYRHFQSSSYDRRSIMPGDDDWFANRDWTEFVRTETRGGRTEYVMADTTGPGALVRIWTAGPAGTIRIYLDDADEPAIEEDMLQLLGGEIAPYDDPFAYFAARGANLYAPIPFATRIVVTTDDPSAAVGGNFYYHVNTIHFAPGTSVEPYTAENFDAAAAAIARVRNILADPTSLDEELELLDEVTLSLSPGVPQTIASNVDGPSQIRRIELTPSDTSDVALRSTLLVISFDGQETVRVPLGDFFGAGPGIHPHVSLITEVRESGTLIARWAMPFETNAEIGIETEGDVTVSGRLHFEARDPQAPTPLRFFAGWRQNGARSTRPYYDWTIADLSGEGLYVGTVLNITNPRMIWWGEGDEKIWVDGESFPGIFGTGTEDYFGYAHTDTGYFSRPFHGQPQTPVGPGNYGRTSNFRWHLIDPIPFAEALRFDLEVWHWEEANMPLDVVSIWYATPSTIHDDEPPMPSELVIPDL